MIPHIYKKQSVPNYIMAEIYKRKDCRTCKGTDLVKFLDFGNMPLAGGFIKKEQLKDDAAYPLAVYFCRNCKEAQVLDIVPSEVLFKDYRFLASVTKTLSNHFVEYAKEMKERFLGKDSLVVEFGSNDGVLLKPFMELEVKAVGVEPAKNIAEVAVSKGCTVVNGLFTEKTAKKISSEYGKADMICANNVFAHIDDMHDVMRGIKALLKPDGIYVFEVHYLLDLVKTFQYDMIYHEHLMYHSVAALQYLLSLFGMEIFEVKRIPIHSGSIRVYSCNKGNKKIDNSVQELLDIEKKEGLDKEVTFLKFAKDVLKKRDEISGIVNKLKSEGKRVVGYGASGRSVIHLNFSNLGKDKIDYVVDESPERVGRFVPGVQIPIVSPEVFRKDQPDYAVLFAYNYEKEVLEKEKEFTKKGGKFIIPIPEIRIVP